MCNTVWTVSVLAYIFVVCTVEKKRKITFTSKTASQCFETDVIYITYRRHQVVARKSGNAATRCTSV